MSKDWRERLEALTAHAADGYEYRHELNDVLAEIEAAVAVAEAKVAWDDALMDPREERESWREEAALSEATAAYRRLKERA